MDPQLNKAAREGNIKLFQTTIDRTNPPPDLALSLTPQKNTALHIAVRSGKEEMAKIIIRMCPSLISQPNSKGNTPLHMAAKAGHLSITKLLTGVGTTNPTAGGDLERGGTHPYEGCCVEVCKMRNLEGSTALHEALKKGHGEVALYLLGLEHGHELALDVNESGESALYLGAEKGLEEVVLKILKGPSFNSQGSDHQTPLHIAAIRGHMGIVKILLEVNPHSIKLVDAFGKTPLHYAAALGHTEIVNLLLKASPSLAYTLDSHGNSALLIATVRGHWTVVREILDHCPDSAELLDPRGRNALHLAVMNNDKNMLKYLLTRPELKELVNEPDDDGNTPLHLSTKKYYRILRLLVRCEGVDLDVTNKDGLTARDVSEIDQGFWLRKLYIRWAFTWHQAGHGRFLWRQQRMLCGSIDLERLPGAELKSAANTLSVLATLVATVTFAAAFTIPGGYKSDGPDQGKPLLMKNGALKVFLLSDSVAFCSSMAVASILVWALLGDHGLLTKVVNLSLGLSAVAVSATVFAFVTGIYVVMPKDSAWVWNLASQMCFYTLLTAIGAFLVFGTGFFDSALLKSRAICCNRRKRY